MYESGKRHNGVYKVNLAESNESVGIYCEFENNQAWTLIQRRVDGSVDFNRNWQEYKTGFGSLDGEFWLGLENIYRLTNNFNYS